MNLPVPGRARTRLGFAVVLGLAVAGLSPAGAQVVPEPGREAGKVHAAVAAELGAGDTGDFWVRFADRPDLSAYADIDDWEARGSAVYEALRGTAERSQAGTRQHLDAAGVDYQAFAISNAIWVDEGDRELVADIVADAEVAQVLPGEDVHLPDPVPDAPVPATAEVAWNVADVNADDVWATGVTGEGIVVGVLDTGVDFRHPALVDHYAGNNGDGTFNHDYRWFDADGVAPDEPADRQDHGTHVTGILVGDDGGTNQIGVAPGARWIAANGCCPSNAALVAAAEWMLAPTDLTGANPRPDLRPHVINNSWSTQVPSTTPFVVDIAEAWAAAGQFAVFANGNSGPGCATAASPGSLQMNYAVGAYGPAHTVIQTSGRGPGANGATKPDIAAPGGGVRSSVPGGGYGTKSGTSMATPHVAGAVALLWSAAPHLVGRVGQTRALLDGTALDTEDLQCGGTAADNNVFGQGRLDAATLVASAPPPGPPTEVARFSGVDRYETAVAISAEFAPGVPVAYLASGRDFPDALAAAAHAGLVDAPVLLTRPSWVTQTVLDELNRLEPARIVVLGGSDAVSEAVLTAVEEATGDVPVDRVGGVDRYETAALVADRFGDVGRVLVVSGRDFPDALAGAALAAHDGTPVLLVAPGVVPAATAEYLDRRAPSTITVLGGEVAVSQAVEEALMQYGSVTRVAGRDRYETATALWSQLPSADAVWVAAGHAWPDALPAAARAGSEGVPLLLTRSTTVPITTWLELDRLDPDRIQLAGGETAIAEDVRDVLVTLP